MTAEIAEEVGLILKTYDPATPRATADVLRDLWLQFKPKSVAAIKADQRAQQEAI